MAAFSRWLASIVAIPLLFASKAQASPDDTVVLSRQGAAVPLADDAESWTVAVRLTPPLARIETAPSHFAVTNVQLGGLAVGAIAPSRIWLEGGASVLHGLEGLGWEATAVGGYALGYARARATWNLSVPVYAGYRFAERPSSLPTDGYDVTRPMHYAVGGVRLVATRFFSSGLLELAMDVSIALPFAEGEPSNNMWRDPTLSWINGALVIGGSPW
jgi:hypothetical protein